MAIYDPNWHSNNPAGPLILAGLALVVGLITLPFGVGFIPLMTIPFFLIWALILFLKNK